MTKGDSSMFRKIFLIFMFLVSNYIHAADQAEIDRLVSAENINLSAIKSQGASVLPILAKIYSSSNDSLKKAKIAWVFYSLGWVSEDAKKALLQDINTTNERLRLQVQWALGRVSNDDEIVTILLEKMRNDSNPLFRDKAACALASDQIHLTDAQHYKLLEGLINSLDDPKLQVRVIAAKALKIQTGQTKGFDPNGSQEERAEKIAEWKKWLKEYQSNL
jgi:HEAT repeat protein